MKLETIAIQGGYSPDASTKACAVPIHQTVAYEFDDAQHGADLFNLSVEGNIYSRLMNPTCDVLEKRVAAMEGGIAALATASGQAATYYAILNLTEAGDNIVTTPHLYGGTFTLFTQMLPRYGVEVHVANSGSAADLEAVMDARTKAVFCESVGNPAGNISDLESICKMAHDNGVPVIVDNTVPTPALMRPIEFGADIVVHSLTKYMAGHGNTIAGIIVDSGKFPWAEHARRFPMFNEPEAAYHGVVYTEALGEAAFIGRARTVALRNTGACLAPMNAFLVMQGMESLALRMERHCQNALTVAEFLSEHPKVLNVTYAGLPSSPFHDRAKKYLKDGLPASLVTFKAKGGYDAAVKIHDSLKLFRRLVNIGDAKSLVCHPASTTHRQLSEEEQRAAGVSEHMIRLSVGIEHIDDILEDLQQAFDSV